jgi:RimJ/RimL family protein N-acetyltransferase
MNYGIMKKDVVTVSSLLLDCLMKDLKSPSQSNGDEYYNHLFTISSVRDERRAGQGLSIKDVSITGLRPALYEQVAAWLSNPAIKNSFVPPFPDTQDELTRYFEDPGRDYFTILYDQEPVGVIGADNVDDRSRKMEMKKFIGNTDLQGRGIGKYATFLFLYYAFIVREFDKVYIHSGDTNIRNIILNSKFGFELEGIFFDDVVVENSKKDVVRMSLFKRRWMEIFAGAS